MRTPYLAPLAFLALALASCAPQGCVAGGPASPVIYAQPSYAPAVVFVPVPARRTVVLVKQTPAPVIRTTTVTRAPAPVYRSQVSTYRSTAGSTSGGSFGGRRR